MDERGAGRLNIATVLEGENMSRPDAKPVSNYVTCPCQYCSGNIEFDANQLDPGQDVSVPCPHCGVETKIFVPEPSVQQPSQQNAEIHGAIGFFGLDDWWLNALTEEDRVIIGLNCDKRFSDNRKANILTQGTITWHRRMGMGQVHHSTGGPGNLGFYLGVNSIDFLLKAARYKLSETDKHSKLIISDHNYALRSKVFQKIIELVDAPSADIVDKHIAYSAMACHFYGERKFDGFAIQRAIWACLKQIEISSQIKPLMRTPARLTQDEIRQLSQKHEELCGPVWKDGKSFWEYCRDQNIFRTNSIVRDSDIPRYDEGYRFLAEIFKNEKQHDRLVALCEKAIEQGWEGTFWKDTLTKNRVYLGDESPASEWLPALPELKWDEILLNVPPTIPLPDIKPKSDVPEYTMHFEFDVLQAMNPEQQAFYIRLVDSIENKTHLSVADQSDYLIFYLWNKYKKLDREELARLYDELLCLEPSYSNAGINFHHKLIRWRYDCLLELEQYDTYLEASTPADIFDIKGCQEASLRCSVRYHLGLSAKAIDLLQLFYGRYKNLTKFTKQHPVEFERILEDVFAKDALKNGSWFERILADSDRANYRPHVFICRHKFVPRFPKYSFDTDSKVVTKQISDAFREAENRLRDLLGEKRVGEKWDEETKLFHSVKKMFPDLQVIHHGQPDWLGRMHLDIWIPELKIAIEYQGQQHFEEMKHFGGAESLEATKKRDALKRSACKREGVQLFEVTSPEDAQQTIREIKRAIHIATKDKSPLF